MGWFSIRGTTIGRESLDQFLALITAADCHHALRKSKKLFPKRQITEVQEMIVAMKPKRGT